MRVRKRRNRRGLSEIIGSFIILLVITSISISVISNIQQYNRELQREASSSYMRIADEINPPVMILKKNYGNLILYINKNYFNKITKIIVYNLDNGKIRIIKSKNNKILIYKNYNCEKIKIFLLTKNGALISYDARLDPTHRNYTGDPTVVSCDLFKESNAIYDIISSSKEFLYYKNILFNNIKIIYKNINLNISFYTTYYTFGRNRASSIHVRCGNSSRTISNTEKTIYKNNIIKVLVGAITTGKSGLIYIRFEPADSRYNYALVTGNGNGSFWAYKDFMYHYPNIDGTFRNTVMALPMGDGNISSSFTYTYKLVSSASIVLSGHYEIKEHYNISIINNSILMLVYASTPQSSIISGSINLNINKIILLNETVLDVPLGKWAGRIAMNITEPQGETEYPGQALYSIAGTLAEPTRAYILAEDEAGNLLGVWRLTSHNLTIHTTTPVNLILRIIPDPNPTINYVYSVKVRKENDGSFVAINGSSRLSSVPYIAPWSLPILFNINNNKNNEKYLIYYNSSYLIFNNTKIEYPIITLMPLQKLYMPEEVYALPIKNLEKRTYQATSLILGKTIIPINVSGLQTGQNLAHLVRASAAIIYEPPYRTGIIVIFNSQEP